MSVFATHGEVFRCALAAFGLAAACALGLMASMAGEADCMEQYGSPGPGRRASGRDGPYGPMSAPAPAPAVQAGDPPPLPAQQYAERHLGDGYCRHCKMHNFKRNQHCRQCGMPSWQFDYPRDAEQAATYERDAFAMLAPSGGSVSGGVKDEEVELGQAGAVPVSYTHLRAHETSAHL
eukprot:15445307-Alexandrium_andersonii.AAC.3